MENRFDEFIHEIDEELKWDRLVKLAKNYGVYVIGGILAIILGTSGYVYWNYHQQQYREAESDKYTYALNLQVEGKTTEALEALKKLEADGGSYGMLALFQRAAILIHKPETKTEAIAIYKDMIQQRTIDRRYRNLAIIFYVQAELDTGNAEELKKLLQEAYVGTNMWPDITAELTALLALRMGDTEQARSILDDLVASKHASESIRMRCDALLQSLGGKHKGE